MRAYIRLLLQRIIEIPTGLLMGDRGWALLRLAIVLWIVLGFMLVGGIIFEREALNAKVAAEALLESPHPFTEMWLLLRAVFSAWASLRYMIMPLVSLIAAIFLGARYIQDIYNLQSYRKVLHYFIAALFDVYYPSLSVEGGACKLKPGEENMIQRIGGPGFVVIRPGSVAIFENLHNPSNIFAEGAHFLTRFEKIRETGSLEEQHDAIDQLASTTKDGVRVSARDIQFRYRILPNRHLRINESITEGNPPPIDDPQSEYTRYQHALHSGRTPWVPYPFSVRAIRNMTYNRVVDPRGLVSWKETVRRQFTSEIRNYIRNNNLDQITAPRAYGMTENGRFLRKPREEIHLAYRRSGFRRRFRELGADLLWYGIGYFEVGDSRVNDQRVETWRAVWQASDRRSRAFAEARRTAYEEQGRAEARAEILMGIIEGLSAGDLCDKQREGRIPELLLVQVSNLLDSIRNSNRPDSPA